MAAAAVTPFLVGSAATATGAATTGLFGAAGAFSFMQTASVLGTAFSAFDMLSAGNAQNDMYKSQARWDLIREKQ